MSSPEDIQLRLINPFITNHPPSIIKYTEPRDRTPSTTVAIDPDMELPISPMSPLSKSDEAIDEPNIHPISTGRPFFLKFMSVHTIGQKFGVRRILQNRLRFLSDSMCLIGLLGLILMVIENEITFRKTNHRNTKISWLIKLIITISTITLVSLVIVFHYFNLKLYATQNSLEHWRVALNNKRISLIILEILICAIHPIPRSFPQNYQRSYITTDVALGLPMFARLYLIYRCIMFHSHLVRDAPSKSLVSFNQVSINFMFLIKTYLEQWPARCLILSCCTIFFIGSWSIRACDYKPIDPKHISLLDSMWLFVITFTTVGYGDITPSTYCGRIVVSITALFGLLSSALLISVVAQKLELTRWEKHVHKFVSDIELSRQRREQAANVIKFAIKIWYFKRKNQHRRSLQYLKSERLLYKSIHDYRQVKSEQRKLNENCSDFIESIHIQRYTSIKTKKILRDLTIMKSKIDKIEEKFTDINHTINNIHNTLNLLMKKNVE